MSNIIYLWIIYISTFIFGHLLVIECAHLIDEACALAACGMRHTLLNHVRGKLVLREHQYLTTHTVNQYRFVLLLAML